MFDRKLRFFESNIFAERLVCDDLHIKTPCVMHRFDVVLKGIKSGCQRKPGKMLKMSTEGGQQN